MTPEQLTAHVDGLAKDADVALFYDEESPYLGYYQDLFKFASVAPIRDYGWLTSPDGSATLRFTPEVAYFIALHELGHNATGLTDNTLRDEGAAWLWAMDHSAIPLTPEQRAFATAALKHYRNNRRGTQVPAAWAQAVEALNPEG